MARTRCTALARSGSQSTCATSFSTLADEYQRQQRDHATLDAQREAAIAAARADFEDVDRAYKRFTAQFQTESRKPDCAAALAAVGRACPALEGY